MRLLPAVSSWPCLLILMGGLWGTFPPGLWAQNLVPNPAFDQYIACPPYLGQIHLAEAWDSPNFATSDFFHRCADSSSGVGVPANRLGWQAPLLGEGYAGIRLWIPPGTATPNQREYLLAPLTTPLEADSLYVVSFAASLADLSSHTTDALGLGLLDSLPTGGPFLPFVPAARLVPGAPLTDRQGWTLVEGQYLARGGERYLLIGNYLPDSSMSLLPLPPAQGEPVLAVYVYIDAVSVRPLPLAVDSLPIDSQLVDCPEPGLRREERYDSLLCAGAVWSFAGPPSATSYTWADGDPRFPRPLQSPGTYTLTSVQGCDTLVQHVRLAAQDCRCGFFPQNIFSPNGDGINDAFDLQLAPGTTQQVLTIRDRWGRSVHTQAGGPATWDGTSRGHPQPAGLYYWHLAYACQDGPERQARQAQGWVVVVR